MNTYILSVFLATICVCKSEGNIKCLKLGVHLYKDIGCPQKEHGINCPSFEDCKYEIPKGKCLYRGRTLSGSESLNANDYNCHFGCHCNASNDTKGSFVCAEGGCGSLGMPVGSGCNLKYSLDQCCPIGQNCEKDGPVAKCTVDGEVYKEGERYTPKNTCLTCVCTSDFNGKHEEPHCVGRPCAIEITHSADLEKNCAPLYYRRDGDEALCCPDTVICPSNDDVVLQDKPLESGKICKYGSHEFRQGKQIQRTVNQYGKNRTVTCECLSPPWLTCSAMD